MRPQRPRTPISHLFQSECSEPDIVEYRGDEAKTKDCGPCGSRAPGHGAPGPSANKKEAGLVGNTSPESLGDPISASQGKAYSAISCPEPPSSVGKSLCLGRPSR